MLELASAPVPLDVESCADPVVSASVSVAVAVVSAADDESSGVDVVDGAPVLAPDPDSDAVLVVVEPAAGSGLASPPQDPAKNTSAVTQARDIASDRASHPPGPATGFLALTATIAGFGAPRVCPRLPYHRSGHAMSEPTPTDAARVRFPPPLVPLLALVVGALAQWLLRPLPLPLGAGLRWVLGGALVVGGVALVGAAHRLFQGIGQDPKPWTTTPQIVTTGVYRYTRNPMYVAMGLAQAGFALLFGNGWMLLLVPGTWAVIGHIAIRHEEAYLEQKFGDAYRAYKRSTRRWL